MLNVTTARLRAYDHLVTLQQDSPLDYRLKALSSFLVHENICQPQTAGIIAAQIICKKESEGINGFVDLSVSTSTCLFVRIGDEQRVVSLKDIINLLKDKDGQ